MNKLEILKQIIKERKSTFPKDYTEKEIPTELIEDIVHTSISAPNHKRTKPWKFIIFQGEEKQKLGLELQSIYKKMMPKELFLEKKYDDIAFRINRSEAVVALICEYNIIVPEWEETAAVAMSVQNMYLMCSASNIGCYWSSARITEHIKEAFTLQENQKCLGLFYMGNLEN